MNGARHKSGPDRSLTFAVELVAWRLVRDRSNAFLTGVRR